MKYIISIFLTCFLISTAASQIEVVKVIKPSAGECDGKIVLSFIASELPGKLIIAPMEQSHSGGVVTIENTKYTVTDLCPGDYNFTFIDNHTCPESVFESIEACEEADFDFNIETEIVDCNTETPFSIYPDFDDYEDYYFEWSTGSTKHFIQDVSAGIYYVTLIDGYGCSQVVEKAIEPIDPFDLDVALEIVPTKIELAKNGNSGIVEIELEKGYPPFEIEWSSSSDGVIKSVAEDGLSISLNYIDWKSDITISVTDKNGCLTEKTIILETCFGMDPDHFDIWYDPFEMKKCSEDIEGEILFHVEMESYFVNYVIRKKESSGWVEQEAGVIEYQNPEVTLNYSEAGEYEIELFDECGFTHTETVHLKCIGEEFDCLFYDELFSPYTDPVLTDCDDDDNKIVVLTKERFESACDWGQWSGNLSSIPYCDLPTDFLIKIGDDAIYKIYIDASFNMSVEAVVESDRVSWDSGDQELKYKMYNDKKNVEIAFKNGCTLSEVADFRITDDEFSIFFAGLHDFGDWKGPSLRQYKDDDWSLVAQHGKIACTTCKSPIEFPYDFFNWGYPAETPTNVVGCKYATLAPFEFHAFVPEGYDPESGICPFDFGGDYKMQLGNNSFKKVIIPAGTPYMLLSAEEGLPQHAGNDWIRCIYAAGYATGPAYSGYPIYVGYNPDFLESLVVYTFEPPTIIDPDCEDEWITYSLEPCKKDVLCYDSNPPTVIGTIPDIESLLPCKLMDGNDCIVVGFCTETEDYYLDDQGEYYIFEEMNCDDPEVLDCEDIIEEEDPGGDDEDDPPTPECNEEYACPSGKFCKNGICKDCPVFEFDFKYSNNSDCIFNFEVTCTSQFFTNAEVTVKLNSSVVENVNLTFAPGGHTKTIDVIIPSGCIVFFVNAVVEFDGCEDIAYFGPPVSCENDCITGGNDSNQYSAKTLVEHPNPNSTFGLIKEMIAPESVEEDLYDAKTNVNIYPNPFKDSFIFITGGRKIKDFKIINTLGQTVQELNHSGEKEFEIDLSNFHSGIYFIHVTYIDNTTSIHKVVKE